MTDCESSSFTFAPGGLWGEADQPRDLSTSGLTTLAGFRVTEAPPVSTGHGALQMSACPVLWASHTDAAVTFPSDAIELHGCLLHDSQYLKHRR